jgi:hypothetical protein
MKKPFANFSANYPKAYALSELPLGGRRKCATAEPSTKGSSFPSASNTAPTSSWRLQYARAFSSPRMKKAVA